MSELTAGLRQTMRMLEKGMLEEVYIARDADNFVKRPVMEAAQARGIPVKYIDNKRTLGHICGVAKGTAVAGLPRGKVPLSQSETS